MSNAHYRKPPQVNPPSEQPTPRQQAIGQLEAGARRRKLTDDAIFRLYLRRDGDRIEAQLKVLDLGIAIATFCRQDELKRAQEKGITLRERGERSVCSFSETRLFSTRQLQLLDRRAEILASCRSEVMEWLSRWDPQDEAALRVALDTCLGEFTEETRRAAECSESPLGARAIDSSEAGEAAALVNETLSPEAIDQMPLSPEDREYFKKTELLKARMSPEDRKALTHAQTHGDQAALSAVISRQPEEWLREFSEATMKLLKTQDAKKISAV